MKRILLLALLLLVSGTARADVPAAHPHDSTHDFDFEFGTWDIHVKKLVRLTGTSTAWTQPIGYVHIVRPLWNGRASLAELEVDRPAPHFAGMMLRLCDPQSQQWRIYWASKQGGAMDPPLVGSFKNGRGTFYNQELIDGKEVYVRVVYSDITPTSFRTEQAFSSDGGASWEPNLIQSFTLRSREPHWPRSIAASEASSHQNDFDFERGTWEVHLRRRVHPLANSRTWVDLDGTSTLHDIWNGEANVGELEVASENGRIEGLSLRLYDPTTQLWSIYFANSRLGQLGMPPMIGRFENGRGEFYDQETLDGRAIFVRFIFDDISQHTFRLVQSFSADGGQSWEPNWIATFTR